VGVDKKRHRKLDFLMSGYDFDTIKSAFNLRDEVIRVLGAPSQQARSYNIHPCPFHAEQTEGAFHVYDENYYCFSCGEGGDVLDWFAWAKNRSLAEIMKEHKLDLTPEQLVERKQEIVAIKLEAKQKADAEYQDALNKLWRTEAWIKYHDNLNAERRQLWRKRGVPDVWQNLWQLGYAENFYYTSNVGRAISDTMTIPLISVGGQVNNVRHRLLNAIDGDKYRPEFAGLRAHPFICDTDTEKAENIIVCEGEIKAMVTYITLDTPGWQVVGIPSKSMMNKTIEGLAGRKNVVVIPDPDGREDVLETYRRAGARVLPVPMKIDDLIIEYGLGKAWLTNSIKQARMY
jgi:hypothetical protein